jgi:hypothetical protein
MESQHQRGGNDVLAVCLCHTLIPSGEGVFDVRHLGRHVSNIARIHLVFVVDTVVRKANVG